MRLIGCPRTKSPERMTFTVDSLAVYGLTPMSSVSGISSRGTQSHDAMHAKASKLRSRLRALKHAQSHLNTPFFHA